jgi:hypothetical protein
MPQSAPRSNGVLTIRIEVRDNEHPLLYRELAAMKSGSRRRVRLFSLAHMGLALEMSGAGTRYRPADETATADCTTPENRLSTSELADLFGETSTQLEDQGA